MQKSKLYAVNCAVNCQNGNYFEYLRVADQTKKRDARIVRVIQNNGDDGNRTHIPAMRPRCAPVTPRPHWLTL